MFSAVSARTGACSGWGDADDVEDSDCSVARPVEEPTTEPFAVGTGLTEGDCGIDGLASVAAMEITSPGLDGAVPFPDTVSWDLRRMSTIPTRRKEAECGQRARVLANAS